MCPAVNHLHQPMALLPVGKAHTVSTAGSSLPVLVDFVWLASLISRVRLMGHGILLFPLAHVRIQLFVCHSLLWATIWDIGYPHFSYPFKASSNHMPLHTCMNSYAMRMPVHKIQQCMCTCTRNMVVINLKYLHMCYIYNAFYTRGRYSIVTVQYLTHYT